MSTQVPNIPKMANAGMVDCSTSELSIAELEVLLEGKKAKLVALNQRKQAIQDELTNVDKELEELSGMTSLNLSRSEAMKESWRKRRELQAKSTEEDENMPVVRKGSLTHLILGILTEDSPKMLTLDQIARRVKKAKWRGRGGPIRQSVYAAIYQYNRKSDDHIKYNKVSKTYGI
jgi:hypothetical protein